MIAPVFRKNQKSRLNFFSHKNSCPAAKQIHGANMWPHLLESSDAGRTIQLPRVDNIVCFCVSLRHGVVVAASLDIGNQLLVYDLASGETLRRLGGPGPGCLDIRSSAICLGPADDSVIVAEGSQDRVVELALADGTLLTQHSDFVMGAPRKLDCDAKRRLLAVGYSSVKNSLCGILLLHLDTGAKRQLYESVVGSTVLRGCHFTFNGNVSFIEVMRPARQEIKLVDVTGTVVQTLASVSGDDWMDAVVDDQPGGDIADADVIVAEWNGRRVASLRNTAAVLQMPGIPLSLTWKPDRCGDGTLAVTCWSGTSFGSGSFAVHVTQCRKLRWAWIVAIIFTGTLVQG